MGEKRRGVESACGTFSRGCETTARQADWALRRPWITSWLLQTGRRSSKPHQRLNRDIAKVFPSIEVG